MAANKLLTIPLKKEELLSFALQGEAKASGTIHGDNVVPCLFGGLNLILSLDPPVIKTMPFNEDLTFVVWHPHYRIDTLKARSILADTILLKQHTKQSKQQWISQLWQISGDTLVIGWRNITVPAR